MPIAALIVSIMSALGSARNPNDSQLHQRNQLLSSVFGLMNNSSRSGSYVPLRNGSQF